MKNKSFDIGPISKVGQQIYFIRGHRVMLDVDLAILYNVKTGNLNLAVRRHSNRFPADFMFQLSIEECLTLRLQFEISNKRGGRRYRPYAFTEQGVAMLSSVLTSDRAAEVNIAIMRAFVRMREILSVNHELAKKLEKMENKLIAHDDQISAIVEAIRRLMELPEKPIPKIGYRP